LRKTGDLISGESKVKAVNKIKDAYSQALNLNVGERAFESRSGKDLAEILVKHDLPLGRYADGTLDASDAINSLQKILEPLNAQADDVLSNPQGVVRNIQFKDVFSQVKSRIQSLNITQAEKNAAIKHAKEILMAEVKQYGAEVTPKVADQIKQGFWGSVFTKSKLAPPIDKLKGNVNYLTGNTLKDAIEKAVEGTDTEVSLGLLNSQRGDLIDAIKRLSTLDGVKLVRGGRLGDMFGGLIGGMAGGSVGGFPGVIAGDLTGKEVSRVLNDPATKISIAKKIAGASGLVPSMMGKSSKPVGQGLFKAGDLLSKSSKAAGLMSVPLVKKI